MEHITRRRFIGWSVAGAAAAVSGLAGSCLFGADEGVARFKARPGKPTKPAQTGLHDLDFAKAKDGWFSVPPGYTPGKPVPLIIFLHGALGLHEGYKIFCKSAADAGIAVVMPHARNGTWDLVLGGFGPDIAFLERVLAYTFDHVAIDPRRVALSGFSDGGSYALSVGLANGDLFTHVMAFSPGFMAPPSRTGKPRIYLAHGRQDEILPISGSRDRLVPQLKQWGYDVTYKEFEGPHGMNLGLAPEVFQWMLK